jgi:hypothetical protein
MTFFMACQCMRANARSRTEAARYRESLHKSKSTIASAAKQSIFARQSSTYGSPRRCAPRDDGLMQIFPSTGVACQA